MVLITWQRLRLISALLFRLLPLPLPSLLPGVSPVKGEERLHGPTGPVLIARDEFGIPHIYAGDEDLFFGQGYAAAQDRLWQMDIWRRAATGRLAEVLGPQRIRREAASFRPSDLISMDLFHRALNFKELARKDKELLRPFFLMALKQYRDGVNAYREKVCRERNLPPEFVILGYYPESWETEDSLAIGRLIGWMLCFAWRAKLIMGLIVVDEGLRSLLPLDPSDVPVITDPSAGVLNIGSQNLRFLGLIGPWSNSWAIDGKKSISGFPILANDPHLPMVLPPFWHLVHLEGRDYQGAGASLPGLPGMVIGRNRHIAWGITAAMLDDADLYREVLLDNNHYLFKGERKTLKMRTEEIRVKGEEPPLRFTLRFVSHGGVDCPLISDVIETREALSLRWPGLEPNQGLEALLALNKARNWDEFREALSLFSIPAQNFIYADRAGNIGYQCAGKIPIRQGLKGVWGPIDGTTGEGEWEGYIPFSELPYLYNPPVSFLATANNRIAGKDYPYYLSRLWEPPYRASRIIQILLSKERFSVEDFQGMHMDSLSLQAQALIAALIKPLILQGRLTGKALEGAEILINWDGECWAESVEAAIFHVFYDRLLNKVFKERMERHQEGLFQQYFSLLHIPVEPADRLLIEGSPLWFREEKWDIIASSIQEAMGFLQERLGPDRKGWAWGRIHTLTIRHPLGHENHWASRLLNCLFQLNSGPYPFPGDGMTINLGGYPLTEPFQVAIGPSYRQVVDLADSEGLWVSLPGGNSGNPLSAHYRDLEAVWLQGRLTRLWMAHQKEVPVNWKQLWIRPEQKGERTV